MKSKKSSLGRKWKYIETEWNWDELSFEWMQFVCGVCIYSILHLCVHWVALRWYQTYVWRSFTPHRHHTLAKFNFSELIWIICAPHLGEEGRTLDSPTDTSWLRNPQWGLLVGSRWTLKHFHFLGMCLTDKSIEYFWSSLNLVFQLPGTFERADVTDVLARRTFWPSYNSPYFPGTCHSYVFS